MNQKVGKYEIIPDGMNRFDRFTKRAFDLVVSAVCLVVFSPLILLCYLAVKCEDGGPAIYKQERVGLHGKTFNILKFRSMCINAETSGPKLSCGKSDNRLTRIGKVLREHHLDELPQLWNVFRGDMAFIGPRPERQFYIDQIMKKDNRYPNLYQIRPGVTSYATLYNGYTDTIDKMVDRLHYDLYYLQHRSWGLDCKILWMTFFNIARGKKF